MKSKPLQKWAGLVLISLLLANSLCAGSLTDYGAIPQLAQPPGNQLNAGQKLDFHTDLFTGRFAYQVPIEVPPARGGTEPGIALQYNSANKNGWCGVGWDLDAGYIQRETRYGVPVSGSSYSDGYGFTFSFGGHSGRLVSEGGGVYYPQINIDFLKFVYSNGWWIVTDKGGRKYIFGDTTASRISVNPYGTFRWALSSTLDPNGNQSVYSYTTDSGQLYLNQIAYNGNTNSPAIATNCAVVFDLSSRTEPISSAISGAEIRTAKLLTGIRVLNQGQLVRRYALGYITSPSTGHALLQSVTQYGSDNVTALPAQTFSYSLQQQSFDSPVFWPIYSQTSTGDPYGISPATADAQLIDVDGDGLPDRVTHPYGANYFQVQYNHGPSVGFSSRSNWASAFNETGDISQSWIQLDSSVNAGDGSTCSISEFLDLNGDGLPDRVMRQHDPSYNHFQAQTNTGLTLTTSIYDWTGVASANASYVNQLKVPSAISSDGVSSLATLADMNGDGLPDRVMVGSANGRFDVQLNTGGGFSSIYAWNNVISSGIRTDTYYAPRARDNNYVYSELIDMNGDGLPDRILNNNAGIVGVQVNNGVNGFGSLQTWNMATSFFPGYMDAINGACKGMLVDMNGDGLPDLVFQAAYGGGTWYVYINNGTGFMSAVTWSGVSAGGLGTGGDAPQAWDANGTRTQMIDMNGDGLPDRVMRYPNNLGTGQDYLEVHYNSGPFPDLLITANNGIGGSVNVIYTPSTGLDNSDGTRSRLGFPVYVVASVTTKDGRGNPGTTTYGYAGGLFDTTYREFRGFHTVQETDPLGKYSFHYFHQGGGIDSSATGEYLDDIAKAGMPYKIDNYGSDDKLYSTTLNKVNEILCYNGGSGFTSVYFPFVQQTIQLNYEGNANPRSTAVGYAYSGITGNLLGRTNWSEVTNVNAAAYTFTAGLAGAPSPVYEQYTYATIPSNHDIIDKPDTVTMSADAAGSIVLQKTLYQYFDRTGDLKQKSELICPGSYAVTQYTYDNYGNVATTTDPVGIVTTANYDSTATFGTRKYTGALTDNLIESTQFDLRSGALLSSTNEQGLVISNSYDVFFRLTNSATSTTPNGAATLWRKQVQYNLGGIVSFNSSNWVRMRENDPADSTNGYHQTFTYLDGLGRPIQTRSESETNGYRVSDLVYDTRGAVILETYPIFSSGSGYTKPSGTRTSVYTQFDPIGRAFKVNPCASATFDANGFLSGTPSILTGDTGSPVGAASVAFKEGANPWAIIITNALGKIHKYYLDAYGCTNQIVEVTSQGNFTTTLKYDLVGNLTNIIDNASNKTSFFYDALGRQVAIADPDMGFWQYGRDAAGRLKVQTDPKGQQIKFYYDDPAGRLTRREGWNNGQQVSLATWQYDSNSGDSAYTIYPGQLYQVADDEGFEKFSYDVRNRTLKSVRFLSKNGNNYTNQFTFDDADRLVQTTYPNGGPVIANVFDLGENLSQVKQVGGSNTVFYAVRGFNALNQLLGVNFGNGVVTTNGYYSVSRRLQKIGTSKSTGIQSLTYTYDALGNVLGVADGVYSGAASASFGNIVYDDLNRLKSLTNASGSFSYAYDSVGNVLTNKESGSGAYSYGTNGIRPHCVRSANGVWYTYDLNGNMVFRGGQRLDYDVNNRLYRVINTNGVTTTFGYDANGARLWESTGTNSLQVWIGNIYEEKNGEILYHIYAGGRQVATFDQTGTNVFQYYHPDNLASTSIQTDQTGNQIQNYGYSAFGQSRYTQSATVFKVSRRYTGQVLDDATGLYYYNFRYYDPQLARFTQPDDIIPDLSNPQSYNRYTYCINNPLRFTDPSGHGPLDELELNAAVQRLANLHGRDWMNYADAARELGIAPYASSIAKGGMDGSREANANAAGAAATLTDAYVNAAPDLATAGMAAAPVVLLRSGRAVEEKAAISAARMLENSASGARRGTMSAAKLTAENPNKVVQAERLLRDAEGKKVIDPLTGEGRRVDHAVIDREANTAKTYETTGQNVDKTQQLAKEQRIRDAGGTYIRDKQTRQLVPVEGKSEIIRQP
jgi:RHS repeat-associated protein